MQYSRNVLKMFPWYLDFHRPQFSKFGHHKTHHTHGNSAAIWSSWIDVISPFPSKVQDLWLWWSTNASDNWKTFRVDLFDLASLKIPHSLNITSDFSHVGIHRFSDTWQITMGTAVYLRVFHPNQPSKVTPAYPKTQATPVVCITILG